MAKKRGRKRLPGERYPSGQLKSKHKFDVKLGPTAERLAKTIAAFTIAGVKPANADPRLGESWFSVLYAAGVIDEPMHDAGNKYCSIYKAMWPQGFPGSSIDPEMWKASETDGNRIISMQPFGDGGEDDYVAEAWAASEKVLEGFGRRAHDLVKNICVFGRFKRFIDTTSNRPAAAWISDKRDKELFQAALDALTIAYGFRDQGAERKAA